MIFSKKNFTDVQQNCTFPLTICSYICTLRYLYIHTSINVRIYIYQQATYIVTELDMLSDHLLATIYQYINSLSIFYGDYLNIICSYLSYAQCM